MPWRQCQSVEFSFCSAALALTGQAGEPGATSLHLVIHVFDFGQPPERDGELDDDIFTVPYLRVAGDLQQCRFLYIFHAAVSAEGEGALIVIL